MEDLKIVNADNLLYTSLDETEFIIEDILPIGLHIFCGAPKVGKSWLMLDICIKVSKGEEILRRQINDILRGIEDVKENNGERFTIKQLEKSKKKLEQKLKKLNDDTKKDNVITFEELGVDRIFVDEAHYYKNLYLYSKMRNVSGIAQTEAQKSSDLFMKTQYLDEITGGKGVVFATGTPVSNSMVELYTMQRYLQYNTLRKHHLQNFDAWASTFGETITAIELTPEGYTLIGR